MKKLYTLLLAVLACCVSAQAADWDIVLNVSKGADRVKAVVGKTETSDNVIKLTDGENNITIPEFESLYIMKLHDEDIVVFKDSEGSNIEKSYYGYYEIYASEYRTNLTPYSLTVTSEAEYRTKSVTVKMDDCSKVSITRGDGTEFNPSESSIDIPYNPEQESVLTISPRGYSDMLYKVVAGGKDVDKTNGNFKVQLVDNSGDEPAYLDEVEVFANYPEGTTFNTTINLNGPVGMISYIRINNTDVTDLEACLGSEGFEAAPGDDIAIGFDNNYKIESIEDNGDSKYAYSQYTIMGIDCDHNVSIKGHKYATFTVKFNVTGAEGFVASLGSSKVPFTDGENNPTFSEKNNYVTFTPAEGYYFAEFTDGTTDYLDSFDYNNDGKVYLNVAEGQEYTVVAKKIRRDNAIVLFMDDFNSLELSYFSVKFDKYSSSDEIVPGYNIMNFRDEDGMFSVFASGSYDGFFTYKNGEFMTPAYDGARYFEDAEVAHNDVYKVFFINNPAAHKVTFDVTGEALEGYSVKHDIFTTTDWSAPVKAIGLTRFTIAPEGRSNDDIEVKVNDKAIEPVDGIYTFETNTDTQVSISTTSGIGSIATDTDSNADVYNMQGIRVAKSADMNTLPAGIYIVNGKKTIIK